MSARSSAYDFEVDFYCALGCREASDGLFLPFCDTTPWPPLFVAAYQEHVDVAAMLITAGADVNAVLM